MATFSEASLAEKLSKLNDTAESINSLSAWILYHRRHMQKIANYWSTEILKIPSQRKLAWIYLANDVVQQSKKRGDDVIKEFAKVLPSVLGHVKRHVTNDVVTKINRVVNIWQERNIFDSDTIAKIRDHLNGNVNDLPGLNNGYSFPVPTIPQPKPIPPPSTPPINPPPSVTPSRPEQKSEKDKKVTVSVPEDAKPLLRYLNVVKRTDAEMEEPTLQIRSLPDAYFDKVGALNFVGTPEASDLTKEIDNALSLLSSYHQKLKRKIQFEEKILLELRVIFDKEEKAMKSAKKRLGIVEEKFQDAAEVRQRIGGTSTTFKIQPLPATQDVSLPEMSNQDLAALLAVANSTPVIPTIPSNLPPSPFTMAVPEPTMVQNTMGQNRMAQNLLNNPVMTSMDVMQAAMQAAEQASGNFGFSFPEESNLDEYDPTMEFVKQDDDPIQPFEDY